MAIEYVDLVMDNGELVRIECPDQDVDDMHESLEHSMKRRDWWSPNQFDGCQATYLGLLLGRVNMARVVGIL
ncbi:MAG: hypothetical protein SV201_04830 [Pseudomonadota bacterium]|nr:hypothetical protein [Pseudomonadota bacterium]